MPFQIWDENQTKSTIKNQSKSGERSTSSSSKPNPIKSLPPTPASTALPDPTSSTWSELPFAHIYLERIRIPEEISLLTWLNLTSVELEELSLLTPVELEELNDLNFN